MANNRLYLVNEDGTKRILLAKYYPSTGWYIFHNREQLDEWLESYNDDMSIYGPTDLHLEYETPAYPKIDQIINLIASLCNEATSFDEVDYELLETITKIKEVAKALMGGDA